MNPKRLTRLSIGAIALTAALSGTTYAQGTDAATAGAPHSRLDDVLSRGTLRVCTTGDYKPYSFRKPDGSFEGIDIDMAESLAKSLGVKVEYVKTTWANLMSDFLAKCDVAVGGVSTSLERQKHVLFTQPYMIDGKTPNRKSVV